MLGRWWPHCFHWTQLSQFTANNFIRVKLSRPCLALLHPALACSGQAIFRFLIQEGKCILTTKCKEKAPSLESVQLQCQLLYLDCWCTAWSFILASYTSYEQDSECGGRWGGDAKKPPLLLHILTAETHGDTFAPRRDQGPCPDGGWMGWPGLCSLLQCTSTTAPSSCPNEN